MKKFLISGLTAIVLMTSVSFASNKIAIRINNQKIDAQAFVDKNNRTLVPLRFIADNLSATTDWNQQNKTATVTQGDKVITLCIPCKKLTINGEETSTDSYGLIQNNRIYVPLRLIAQAFGANVGYKKRVVDINTDGSTPSPMPNPNPPKEEKPAATGTGKMKQLDMSILPEEARIWREGDPLYDGVGLNWNVRLVEDIGDSEGFGLTYNDNNAIAAYVVTTDGEWIISYVRLDTSAMFIGNYSGIEIDKVLFSGVEEYKKDNKTDRRTVHYLVDIPNVKVVKK
ncbi:MAG: copper amine oxidase N-terminal domain-containing protein [Peptostreptococcaceae bacterium]|nr:copper amine oxidase N-terminal domain-containing protein [Peptostreptococcaceae bacterium]